MNDEEFRKKCREFSYQQMDDYFKDYQERDAFKSKEGIAIALLYIAANIQSPNESNEKPCEYCNPEKQKIFHNPCGSVSHYLYVNTKQKKLADAYDETKDKWVAIKYCPMCGRKL